MKEYSGIEELVDTIRKTAKLFIEEFDNVLEEEKAVRIEGVDRTPQEMVAYQLGWMDLMRHWESEEQAGRQAEMPASGFKWNKLGGLYQNFYQEYENLTMHEMQEQFSGRVELIASWISGLDHKAVFEAGGRKWAKSTPSNWPIWKWVHISTVAPFKTFRTKIRKWKRARAEQGCPSSLERND